MTQRTKLLPKSSPLVRPPLPDGGTPTWEIAYLFPVQGAWTEEAYFNLDRVWAGVPRVELSNGRLDVVAMPTPLHQFILVYLMEALSAFAKIHAPGPVLPSGLRVRLKRGLYREPDLAYMRAKHARRRHYRYWDGADLVMEVVSPGSEDIRRDWETKPIEYARAGIPEFWIVDPHKRVIRVLTLKGRSHELHGDFGPGEVATSVLLAGFSVAVDDVLAAGGPQEDE